MSNLREPLIDLKTNIVKVIITEPTLQQYFMATASKNKMAIAFVRYCGGTSRTC